MAKKPNISTVASGYQGTVTINNNFQNIRNQFDNTLSLDGSTPNAMLADLDMNSNDILNAGEVSVASLRINSQPVVPTSVVYNGIIKETKVATSGQTVFNLTTISYTPNTNNLSVYVDGIYQKPANYTENSATQVTFSAGLHVGAIVDFVVLSIGSLTGTADATNITYTPAAQSLYGTTSITVKSALDQVTHEETGSSKVGFLQSGTGAAKRTVQAKLRDTVSVKDFGAVGNGVADDTIAIQNAIDSLTAGTVFIPRGTYLITAPILTKSNISIQGEGNASQLLVNSDIEVIYSSTATLNTAIFQAEFRDFFINKTVAGATTKYDIHLYNPNICYFKNVHIKSGHVDTSFSATNKGGIWLDCSENDGGTTTAFMNTLENCWLQNNSLYLRDVTDTNVNGGFYWGHTRQFAIRVHGGGAINITNISGLISSQYKGGIWLDNTGSKPVTMIRIQNNFWDGSYSAVRTGYGIFSESGANEVSIIGNTFWACEKHQVYAIDPIGWTITGNVFFKGNDLDTSQDDIRIESKTFPASRNTVTANTFNITDARVNKGYAIREVNNGGGLPTSNSYVGNTVLSDVGYLSPPIYTVGAAQIVATNGEATQIDVNRYGSLFGNSSTGGLDQCAGIVKATNALVNAAGTFDLDINSGTFLSQPTGFVGHLYVSSARYNATGQSRKEIFTVFCYDTTAVITSVGAQSGSLGSATFTITVPSSGVLRFTDTSGQQVAASMMFVGTRSL